jgi:hypothetical protein
VVKFTVTPLGGGRADTVRRAGPQHDVFDLDDQVA